MQVISYVDTGVDGLVRGDSGRIKQIVLNLLSNAVKFTKSGGIMVTCEKDTIDTDSQISLLIKVTDTGIGIPKAAQAKLFNRFTQVRKRCLIQL
jgi:signal transduction histidine kinase